MKKIISTMIMAFATSTFLMANVLVEFPSGFKPHCVKVSHHKISDCVESVSGTHIAPEQYAVIPVNLGTACIVLDEDEPARYSIDFENGESAVFYASPEDELVVDIVCLNPIVYSVKGTELAEGWSEFELQARPLLFGLRALYSFKNPCQEQIAEHQDELAMMVGKYLDARPTSDSALAVLLFLHGPHFMHHFLQLSPELKSSYLYPVAQSRYYAELAQSRVPLDGDSMFADDSEI